MSRGAHSLSLTARAHRRGKSGCFGAVLRPLGVEAKSPEVVHSSDLAARETLETSTRCVGSQKRPSPVLTAALPLLGSPLKAGGGDAQTHGVLKSAGQGGGAPFTTRLGHGVDQSWPSLLRAFSCLRSVSRGNIRTEELLFLPRVACWRDVLRKADGLVWPKPAVSVLWESCSFTVWFWRTSWELPCLDLAQSCIDPKRG